MFGLRILKSYVYYILISSRLLIKIVEITYYHIEIRIIKNYYLVIYFNYELIKKKFKRNKNVIYI